MIGKTSFPPPTLPGMLWLGWLLLLGLPLFWRYPRSLAPIPFVLLSTHGG